MTPETTTTDIQVTRAGTEPGAATFRVEVPAERVARAEAKAAKQFAKQARLPGFRKGRAPLAVVRRRYHDAIREQVLREVIGESWKQTLDQEDLDPIADPHVHDLTFEDGQPLTFELHVEVKPELSLERLGGFTLQRAVQPVTDEMVAEQLAELRRQRAPWVPLEEARRPQPGEMVSITLATLTDGEPSDEKQYQLVLGEGQAIPDIEERIRELSPGETADATVTFPPDFPDESKRGQSRQVRLTLHEIKRMDLPELDDDFAREVGDFEDLAALRVAVREDLETDARREADAAVRRQLIDEIAGANAVPAPRPLMQRLLNAYARAYGIGEDQFQQFATEFAPVAEMQVKRDLILDHVAREEGLQATEAELDERVAEIARRRNQEPGEVYAALQKAGRLKEIEQNVTEEKVFAHLLAQSTITDS